MQTNVQPISRKRRRSDQCPSKTNEGACEPVFKRPKTVYPSGYHQSAAFWDNLSVIPLTKRALLELDRRNAQAAKDPFKRTRACQFATRRTVAASKETQKAFKSPTGFLLNSEHHSYSDLKSFARRGGPDLLNLRGFRQTGRRPKDRMASSHESSTSRPQNRRSIGATQTANTSTTRNTSTYDRAFQQHLIDHGAYPSRYKYPDGSVPPKPVNFNEIQERLRLKRSSLSPSKFSDEQHERFVQKDADAAKENQVRQHVIPIIEGEIRDLRTTSGEIPFTNLAPITKRNLVPGNPDFYHGARPEQLKRQVRDELSDLIVPSTEHDRPIIPNHFTAVKDPGGTLLVGGRQAYYDGALGARSIHALQSYGQNEPQFNGKAYTVTCLYHGGDLKLYTSHPIKPDSHDVQVEYHTNMLRSFSMTDSPESWRQGATAYRNSIDWAKEQRDDAIKRANDAFNHGLDGPSPPNAHDMSFGSTIVLRLRMMMKKKKKSI